MKKLFFAIVLVLGFGFNSLAQSVSCDWGFQGGLSYGQIRGIDADHGWHAGLSAQINLPLYFSIQPSIIYKQLLTKSSAEADKLKTSFMELPVAVQWGPDLGIIRPFLQVVPYAGLMVIAEQQSPDGWVDVRNPSGAFSWGVGLGAGLNIWKLQFAFRYNFAGIDTSFSNTATLGNIGKLNSVDISLSVLF